MAIAHNIKKMCSVMEKMHKRSYIAYFLEIFDLKGILLLQYRNNQRKQMYIGNLQTHLIQLNSEQNSLEMHYDPSSASSLPLK